MKIIKLLICIFLTIFTLISCEKPERETAPELTLYRTDGNWIDAYDVVFIDETSEEIITFSRIFYGKWHTLSKETCTMKIENRYSNIETLKKYQFFLDTKENVFLCYNNRCAKDELTLLSGRVSVSDNNLNYYKKHENLSLDNSKVIYSFRIVESLLEDISDWKYVERTRYNVGNNKSYFIIADNRTNTFSIKIVDHTKKEAYKDVMDLGLSISQIQQSYDIPIARFVQIGGVFTYAPLVTSVREKAYYSNKLSSFRLK